MPVRIVVDERERSSNIPELLKNAGAVIDFTQLKVGDYVVSSETAVERKTVRDLISSIYDGRLFVQCSDLVRYYQKPLLVVQGNIADLAQTSEDMEDPDDIKLHTERMSLAYDALITVATEFRIPIIHTPSAEQTAQLLVTLVNRSLQEAKATGPLLRKIKKENPIHIQQLSVLASLPGVGEKLAARMLKKFHTPIRALNASAAELATIPGFGLTRAERVRKVLNTSNNVKQVVQSTLFDNQDK
ncbi:MAG: helix-hairpin-helix domain-containing protein [Thermoproteota archaeon]|nr:helix-hairpin-helix domain-containing protein [Thermoproteota archaeon]